MESVNGTFDKAIKFLSIIQTVCEERRSQVEQLSVKYYVTYCKDRKEELKKNKEVEAQKNCKPKDSVDFEKTDSLEVDGLEELALADSVLQKAQNIRSQTKVTSQIFAALTSTSSECLLFNDKHSTSTMKKTANEDCSKNHAALPRCNSAPNATKAKLSQRLQSKSVNDFISRKETCLTSTVSNARKLPIAQISTGQKSRTVLNSNVGCISSKNYKDLKCLTLSSSLKKHKGNNNKSTKDVVNTSDSSQNPHHHSPPLTYQSFKQDLTKRCCLESNFRLPSNGFWYPFITFKNKESLIRWSKSDSSETFITVVNLAFEIQEIMMWIDLLSFVGSEIFPSLRFAKKSDRNVIRLCSYLSSIYHESLQRIPVLDSD